MTLSYNPPKVATPSNVRLSFASHQSDASLAVQPIRLADSDCLIKPQVPLASLTSLRVGGPAQWYVAPSRFADLQASFMWAQAHNFPVTLLGAGSNLLISDRGLPGLVISTRRLRQHQFNPALGQVTVGAGDPLPRLAWLAAERGWQGLAWAVGIPGTVGGAVVMNAGAHGGCTADALVNAHVLLPDGTTQILTPQDLRYRYRTSALQGKNWLVTEATFQLQPGFDPVALTDLTRQHHNQRLTTQPYHLPSCGSVFRNPIEHKAGWLIEQAGLKGYQIGGAQIAERHANFILNCGNAMASDIFRLIQYVQQQVEQRWSLQLEPEVKILGDFQAQGV